jgi:hypothetical protein
MANAQSLACFALTARRICMDDPRDEKRFSREYTPTPR